MKTAEESGIDPVEVIRWYREHPEYEKQVIDLANQFFSNVGCSSIDELVEEFIFSNFAGVGFIPEFVLDYLGDSLPSESELWSYCNSNTDRSWRIFQFLWFIVGITEDPYDEGKSFYVVAREQYESLLQKFTNLVDEEEDEIAEYLVAGEATFTQVDDLFLAKIKDAMIIHTAFVSDGWTTVDSSEHYVELLHLVDATYALLTHHYGVASNFKFVESESEGREIIEGFW
jgi:hypothetical protein